MKKLIRSISAGVICAVMLMSTACNSGTPKETTPATPEKETTEAKKEETPKVEESPKAEELSLPDKLLFARSGYFGDASENPELKAEYMEYFKGKYGVNLEVNTIPRQDYMQKVELMIGGGELKGLVNVFSMNDVLNGVKNGMYEPLDDYLADNEVWNSMDQKFKDSYKIDGVTYAIPFGYTQRSFTRSIRKDWLDKLGLEVPKTVEEFYEVAKAFTEQDPDGNGIKDTFGLTSAKTWMLQDIFQAFGARLSEGGSYGIVWDPETNNFNDSMLKPEMVDAINYLKDMYANGYLDTEWASKKGANARETIAGEKAGSIFYWDMYGTNDAYNIIKLTNPKVEFVEIVGLTGKATKNINYVMGGSSPLVMVTGTPQAKETINAYVNLFLGNAEANIDGRFGIKDKTYKMEGNDIVRQIDPATSTPYLPANISGEYPAYSFSVYPYFNSSTPEEIEASRAVQLNRIDLFNKGLESGLLYNDAYQNYFSDTFITVRADIIDLFDSSIALMVSGQVSVEEGMANYRAKMKALGGDQILKELNAAYGLKDSEQQY